MTRARVFSVPNRLEGVISEYGGLSYEELTQASEARLASLAPALRSHVLAEVAAILSIHAQGEEALFGQSVELGVLALNIAETARAGGLAGLGEVAKGIRAMVDSLLSSGVWHSDALELHISALSLLSDEGELSSAEMTAMLERLSLMRARVGVVE